MFALQVIEDRSTVACLGRCHDVDELRTHVSTYFFVRRAQRCLIMRNLRINFLEICDMAAYATPGKLHHVKHVCVRVYVRGGVRLSSSSGCRPQTLFQPGSC